MSVYIYVFVYLYIYIYIYIYKGLIDGTDFSETLTRARFEELNLDLFKKTLGPVQKVSHAIYK
jgi:molecular chaperone DnaK (HSP70)